MYVHPPLCREPSQGIYGLRFTVLVCEGETVGKIGDAEEMDERELVLVVNVATLYVMYLWVYCSQNLDTVLVRGIPREVGFGDFWI